MKDTTKVTLAIVGTALVVGGGGAIAAGGGGSTGSGSHGASGTHALRSFGGARPAFAGRAHDGHRGLGAAATYLGLTEDALHTQLESGKTLAQVAQAQGKSVSGLEDALVAAAKTHLDADVAAGRITSAQETQLLADVRSHVADFVNGKLPARGPGAPGDHGGHFLDAAATYLGLSEDALHAQLDSGKTLAQVAQAQGKTVSGLEDAIVASAKTHLDADVAAGRITADEETQLLADLKSHVADLVSGKAPTGPRGMGAPMHGPAARAGGPFS